MRNAAPDSILAITFTDKASTEMAERVEQLLQYQILAKPMLATFHSFCVRLLRLDVEVMLDSQEIYLETDKTQGTNRWTGWVY